jgi:hypothetical protein
MFASVVLFHPILVLSGKAGAYQSGATYSNLLALPTNIKLGWKWMAETNALAYYDSATVTSIKSLIV